MPQNDPVGEGAPGDRDGLDPAIAVDQIRLLIHKRADLPINLLNSVIVSGTLWPLYPGWLVLSWLGLFCSVILTRSLIRRHYRIAAPGVHTAAIWGRIFTLNAFATGCLWGLTGSVVLMTPNPMYHIFIVFVLGGMMAGGIVSNSAYMPAMLAFMLPTIVPVIVLLMSLGTVTQIEMAVMLGVFAAVLIIAGRNINRSIIENFRMRFAQEALLGKLRTSEAAMAEAQAIARVGSWEYDAQTGKSAWSSEIFHILGLNPAATTPSNDLWLARVHPDDLPMSGKTPGDWTKSDAKDGTDRRIVTDDGTVKWVHETSRKTVDAQGRALRMNGTLQDISERMLADRALQYREYLLHAVTVGTGVLVKADSLDQGMPEALRILGESLQVDRVIVMQEVRAGEPLMTLPSPRYVWQASGSQFPVDASAFALSPPDRIAVAAWHAPLAANLPVMTHCLTSEGPIHALLERSHIESSLMVPIFVGEVLWGALGIDSCRIARDWQASEIDTLKTFSEIAGSLITHGETRLSLLRSEDRFRVLSATAQDAIITIDAAGRIGTWNTAAERTLGYSAAEAIGQPVHDFLAPPRFRQKADPAMRRFATSGTGDALGKTTELAARKKDGSEIAIELSLAGARLGDGWEAIGILRDITLRKQTEANALRMARFDVLTGLANRSVFVEALQHAIAAARRGESGFAVLYLDLDRFKDVNDTLGHPVGDELLRSVADRLRSSTRITDTIARFGGDEFAVVAANCPHPADAAILAEKLIKAIGTPFPVKGSDIHTGVSIGIAAYGADAPDPETLLSHADVALYRAKSEGRNAYRFFTDAMDTEVQIRVALGAELRVAVDAGQLFLMYQPQVEMATGKITGVEALVRWRHPQRGVLGPGLFIPIAEQIGIIAKIGHWVLWTACRQGKAWLDAGIAPLRISVNVSALQFRSPLALEADIAAALAETGLPSQLLELELTETVLMDASREHNSVIQRIRDTGVTVAIDDFGTGYSSLDYLRRYPSNRIKIAQTFVDNLETTPGNASIIKATIGLARELGITVIAEGVETRAQAELLKTWGCGQVQGFYFAHPLAVDDATSLLRNGVVSAPNSLPPVPSPLLLPQPG